MTQKEQDVMDAAEMLISANGQTTTLEIKEKLRKDRPDQWYQSEVSAIMDDLYKNGHFDYQDVQNQQNVTHRQYFRTQQIPTALPSGVVQLPSPLPTGIPSATVTALMATSTTTPKVTYDSTYLDDKGIWRTKSGRKSEFQPGLNKCVKIGILKAIDMIKATNGGSICTAWYVKTDKKDRVINFKYMKDQVADPQGYMKVYDMIEWAATGDSDKSIRNLNPQTLKVFKMNGIYYEIDRH